MTSKVSRTSDAQRGVACAGSHFLTDHIPSDTQPALVGEDSSPRSGHGLNDLRNLAEVHIRLAGAGPNVPDHVGFESHSAEGESDHQEPNVGDSISRSSHGIPGTQGRRATASQVIPDSQRANDTHARVAVGESHVLNGHRTHDAHPGTAVEVPTPQSTNGVSTTGALDSGGQEGAEAHTQCAVAQAPSGQAMPLSVPIDLTPVLTEHPHTPTGADHTLADQSAPVGLTDPLLALAADVLDDLERVRIANENRLRQLTRDVTDKDGEERGFGLTLDHPDVARLAALVEALAKAEHDATLNLQRMVRKHPLGPWIKAAKGIGEKQGARLLAAIGDPYWNDLHQRPRTVSELWAYTGYHVIRLPGGQCGFGAQVEDATGTSTSAHQYHHGTQVSVVGGDLPPVSHPALDTHPKCVDGTGGDSDQACHDTQAVPVGVAPCPMRGQRVNWSPTAKMRARLISESIVKAGGPYREEVYDAGRAKYAEALHRTPCRRCGPSGKPALIGSALSDGHKHARALRLVSKEILKGLWKEAKRLHEDNPQTPEAATDGTVPNTAAPPRDQE